jgi:hypothetical protein
MCVRVCERVCVYLCVRMCVQANVCTCVRVCARAQVHARTLWITTKRRCFLRCIPAALFAAAEDAACIRQVLVTLCAIVRL